MANRWTENHDLQNDWRRGDIGSRDEYRQAGGDQNRYSGPAGAYQERSFSGPSQDRGFDQSHDRSAGYGDRFSDFDRSEGAASRGYGRSADWRGDDDRRVFGERESGADYRPSGAGHRPSGFDGSYATAGRYYGDTGRGRHGYDRPRQDRGYSDAWDRSLYGEGYREGGYSPNVRDGRGDAGRGFWDRAGDEVSSWFGDRDAERRREWDAAQRGEHRGRGPEGYRRSDARISEDVHDRLTDDEHLDAGGVRVQVEDGEVTLDGTVRSRACKRRAEDLAESVGGVKHVQNNLRVDEHRAATTTAGRTTVSDKVTSVTDGDA